MPTEIHIGQGYDAHRLVAGRPLVLGGVTVPAERGPDGWSDGDPLAHAVIDALLGAAGLGDIGRHFPPGDAAFKDAAGPDLLRKTTEMLKNANHKIVNVDATVRLAAPALAPHIAAIAAGVAAALDIDPKRVNIKAKSGNGLGFVGRGEGIAADAAVLIEASA
jgi:2-C-methyl-D-erythritol 2,4-cyclodiphosphate synthase